MCVCGGGGGGGGGWLGAMCVKEKERETEELAFKNNQSWTYEVICLLIHLYCFI